MPVPPLSIHISTSLPRTLYVIADTCYFRHVENFDLIDWSIDGSRLRRYATRQKCWCSQRAAGLGSTNADAWARWRLTRELERLSPHTRSCKTSSSSSSSSHFVSKTHTVIIENKRNRAARKLHDRQSWLSDNFNRVRRKTTDDCWD